MASLNKVSSSNYLSSLMNSANTITGLASGLDTESMIENLVKSYQTKITQLNQKITKVEWKQEAYRSVISQLVSLSNKYTSYTSNTNLMSPGFFTNSVKVAALGKYADAVTASGKTSSDVTLNAVRQLASAAQYRTAGNLAGDSMSIESSTAIDMVDGKTELSNLDGTMTLTYGSQNIKISFDQTEDMDAINKIRKDLGEGATDEQVLAELINQKLADQKITFTGSGETVSADKRIQAVAGANGIEFKELGNAGNGVKITNSSGNIGTTLGISDAKTEKPTSFKLSGDLTQEIDNKYYLSNKSISMTLDGTTKSITLPEVFTEKDENGEEKTYIRTDDADNGFRVEYSADEYANQLNKEVQKAFGDKVTVSNEGGDLLKLKFTATEEGASLEIKGGDIGKALGIGETATNYMSTSKTLGEMLGMNEDGSLKGVEAAKDKDGNVLKDENGNELYDFVINGVKVGTYTKDTKLSELMNDINSSEAGVKVAYSQTTKNFTFTAKETGANSKVEMGDGLAKAMFGVPVSGEDKASDVFDGVDWGENGQVLYFEFPGGGASFNVTSDMTMDEILENLNDSPFGYTFSYDTNTGKIVVDDGEKTVDVVVAEESKTHREQVDDKHTRIVVDEELEYTKASKISYTEGQDAIFDVTVNGERIQMTRSSNSVNIDGLTITANDTFDATVDENGNAVTNIKDAVTFKTSTDSDKIVDAVKSMIAEYNLVMSEIKSYYGTMPYQNSNGSFGNYEPLTDEDMEGMSESAIARYEEKAKQGILFGDQTLSGLYSKLADVFSFNNTADVDTLREMGISVSFNINGGEQTVTLDEDKLRAMLDSDPDRVANLFTKSDGIMDRMKTQLDNYAKTTGEPKGILIQQAGSPLSSLSLMSNNWQSEIDNYNEQIERWQTKLESQVERYTSQFARLEQLINQMNSQSSALAGMLGN